jgi:hypothetical protein
MALATATLVRTDDTSVGGGLLPVMSVGRASSNHIVLASPHVSHEHASLRHAGGCDWVLRDLGSKNGMFVNHRSHRHGDVKLRAGDELSFGNESSAWRFSPGVPCDMIIVGSRGNAWLSASREERLIALPALEAPEATLSRRGADWVLETLDSDAAVIGDGHILTLGSDTYRIRTSEEIAPTEDASAARLKLGDARLLLSISLDEEQIAGELRLAEEQWSLPSRVYLHLLAFLARSVRADAAQGVPPGEVGWRYSDEVSKALTVDPNALNLLVHRARQDVAKFGIEDPAALIQRRNMTKQMRIGIAPERIQITAL